VLTSLLILTSAPDLFAQNESPGEDDIFNLDAYEVVTTEESGYRAPSSIVASGFSLQNVDNPITITSLSGLFVEDMRFDDLTDATAYMSGATKSPSQNPFANGSGLIVRGFDTFYTNRNGIFRYIINGTDNLDRLEIIKGPAAVFFGQASPGGILNYVTKRPSFIPDYNIEATVGSYQYKRIEVGA